MRNRCLIQYFLCRVSKRTEVVGGLRGKNKILINTLNSVVNILNIFVMRFGVFAFSERLYCAL